MSRKLSAVPFKEIFVGMELISAIGTPGKIVEKLDRPRTIDPEIDNWIKIDWENGKSSYDCHYLFDKVTVK